MKIVEKLLIAQNGFVNEVFKTLTDSDGPTKNLEEAQREAARMVGGILIGVKVALAQAMSLIEAMDLEDVGS